MPALRFTTSLGLPLAILFLVAAASPVCARGGGAQDGAQNGEDRGRRPGPKDVLGDGPGAGPIEAVPQVERLELDRIRVDEALRLLSELSGLNVVATPAAAEREVTGLLLQDVSARTAIETLCKLHDLWYRIDGPVVRIMTAEEYQRDLTVVRDPELRVFNLLHPNPVAVAMAIRDLFGARVRVSLGVDEDDLFGQALGGDGRGGQRTSLGGSSAGRFSSRLGGGAQNTFVTGMGVGGIGGGGALARDDDEQALTREDLSAERLARLEEEGGRITGGDLEGVTRGRPVIAVTVNRRNNLVVVRTSDREAMSEIERLVVELDRPTPQVLLEVKVLEVRLGDAFHSVVDVDWVDGPMQNNLPTGKPANPLLGGAATVAENVLAGGNLPLVGGALVYQYLNEHVRVRLQLLDRENRLSVLATPLLLCANDQAARIFIGEERPLVRNFELQTTTTNGVVSNQVVPTVDLRDIGQTLRMVPRINADRTVTLTIVQDISSVNPNGAVLPVPSGGGGLTTFAVDTVSTANLEGTVVARDGETLAVGGLIRKELVDRQEGVPLLMDLPLIGWLFGETVRAEERRELILLITPHVLLTPGEGEARTRERLRDLSLHPYLDLGDQALDRHERDDVPGAADYRLLLEDYLAPVPDAAGSEAR